MLLATTNMLPGNMLPWCKRGFKLKKFLGLLYNYDRCTLQVHLFSIPAPRSILALHLLSVVALAQLPTCSTLKITYGPFRDALYRGINIPDSFHFCQPDPNHSLSLFVHVTQFILIHTALIIHHSVTYYALNVFSSSTNPFYITACQ